MVAIHLIKRALFLRIRPFLIWITLFGVVGGFIAMELREGRLQAWLLSDIAEDVHHTMGYGPSDSIQFPQEGPYDTRLGYTRLPQFIDRLAARGAEVQAQARWSSRLSELTGYGLFPLYDEKPTTGLTVVDRGQRPLYDVPASSRTYPQFSDVPPVVANSLMYIENRELLDPRRRHRNPAVEWDRFAYAVGQAGIRLVKPNTKVPGASTLATQMEKYRHSRGGRTHGVRDKLRQMASAAIRAYLDGPDTLRARQDVLRDYLNGVPLAAVRGHGAVHGFGDALFAYFGTDFERATTLLARAHAIDAEDPLLAETARIYRQSLGLLLSLRRPMRFLKRDRPALEQMIDHFLGVLHTAEIIPTALRDAARAARLDFVDTAAPSPVHAVDKKGADAARIAVMRHLGVDSLYDLDRLDLTVTTTFDGPAQRAVSETLRLLQTPEGAAAAGLYGRSLLRKGDDPSRIQYSFSLYERVGGVNAVRIHTDSVDGPFSLNDGMKLELGSTAKLRTLITWLELIAESYHAQRHAPRGQSIHARDTLGRWVAAELRRDRDVSLTALLDRALDRRFSADPNERFFTGGGTHKFHNFDKRDDFRRPTVRDALQRSVNLPFVRMMREVVYHITWRDPASEAILANPDDARRVPLLERFARHEGAVYLQRYLARYAGLDADAALDVLSARADGDPDKLAIIHRTARPDASIETFARWVQDRADAPLALRALVDLYADGTRFDLQDRGYVTGIHPLELWAVARRHSAPQASTADHLAAAEGTILEVYQWLIDSERVRKQNSRIRQILEQDAFAEIHRRWQRLGFPFERLVPSYGSALGSSGDRPAALAELMGILSAGGLRHPVRKITRFHFAEGTPFETVIGAPRAVAPRVLLPEVAAAAREAVLGVVARGTARRARGAFGGGALVLGGKTGTGDNRSRSVDKHGRVIAESVRNRTATLVFLAGNRWFGVVTAYVPGEIADDYSFTSALPTQVLKYLAPTILPAFGTPAVTGTTQVSLQQGPLRGGS